MRADTRSQVYLIGSFNNEETACIALKCMNELLLAHKTLKVAMPITLFISSGGGYIDLGLAIQSIIEQMRREGRKVIGHVVGYAHSSAFDILQHCDIRKAEPTAGFVVHEDQFRKISGSTTSLMRECVFSHKLEKAQWEGLAKRTGKSVQYYKRKTAGKDWFLTAQEAFKEKLLDELIQPIPFRKG